MGGTMTQYSKEIIETLRRDHPDLSSWSIICASETAVAPVQYMIHRELGGILPTVGSFDSYAAGKIASLLGLAQVPGDERLLYFTEFIAGYFPDEPRPARLAGAVLPLITKMAAYGVKKGTIAASDRLTDEQWESLMLYLDMASAFREWLGEKKLFMAELEAGRAGDIVPGDREIFVGLPEMTPSRERFYKKINAERLFVGRPLFGRQLAGIDAPGYDSAANLVSSFGGDVLYSDGENIELVSLAGLFDLAELVLREVSDFLRDRKPDEQLFIFLLDESLTPMLWSIVFRNFGTQSMSLYGFRFQRCRPEKGWGWRSNRPGSPGMFRILKNTHAAPRRNWRKTGKVMCVRNARRSKRQFLFPIYWIIGKTGWGRICRMRQKCSSMLENSASPAAAWLPFRWSVSVMPRDRASAGRSYFHSTAGSCRASLSKGPSSTRCMCRVCARLFSNMKILL